MTPRKLYNFYIDPDLAAGLKRLKALDRARKARSFVARCASTRSKGRHESERKRVAARQRS